MSHNKINASYWPGLVLFCLSLAIGLSCYRDYGISWDEPAQRGLGRITYNYVTRGDNTLKTYDDRGLGPGFELPLIFMEKWLRLDSEREIYLARHLATHIFFLLGVFCGYILALRVFKNQFIACLCFIIIAFHPRIYAHSFFNTKDIPFLSAFLIVMLVTQVAFEKNKPWWYLLLGAVCGYATSIREMGILFALVIGLFFIFDLFRSLSVKDKVLVCLRNALLFVAGFCGMLYISWPVLWSRPVFYFLESFHNLSNITWTGEVLFNGEIYKGNMLPLDYMPAWFSITVPELWLVAGLAGLVWLIAAIVKAPRKFIVNSLERNFLFYIACFVVPVIAMAVLHGVNIDDWRHLYFIYPPFVMLALFAINKLATGRKKLIIRSVCFLQIVLIAFFMIGNHPFQQVYFNNFVSHKKEYLRKNYDLEYWGCSYKQGLDYVLSHDTSSVIRISGLKDPVANAVRFLPGASAMRILMVSETEHPDYFITNFRMHPGDYNYRQTFYEIEVLNSTILRVYKLKS